jgi:hypothetical protein
MKYFLFIIICVFNLKLIRSDSCFYDEYLTNANICLKCSEIISNCLRCINYNNNTICIECLSGYIPILVNGIIDSCNSYCTVTQFRDIVSDNFNTPCNCKNYLIYFIDFTWASIQTLFSSYDMMNNNPHPNDITETSVLIEFYQSLNGDFWLYNDNWLNGDPCLVTI